jgi:DNA polymerase-3 subunit delta
MEEEDKDGGLKIMGMLNRQIRLLWQAKSVIEGGGRAPDVARKIRLPIFLARRIVDQSKNWSTEDLERAIHLLYQADGLIKSGSQGRLVLENLILSLCH